MKVLWIGYMEEVVCNRDDHILIPLFNFQPMKGLSSVEMFESAGNGTCKSILHMLKALDLSNG